jgi:hypothetical protein
MGMATTTTLMWWSVLVTACIWNRCILATTPSSPEIEPETALVVPSAVVGDHSRERQLALWSPRSDSMCLRLRAQILGTVRCECQYISTTQFRFKCASFQQMCDPLNVVCGVPSLQGTIGLDNRANEDQTLELLFQGAACVSNIAIRGGEIIAEPLCVQLPYEDNTSGGSLILNWINALLGRVQGNENESASRKETRDCVAKVGEVECMSCSRCPDTARGYTFNCTNVHAEMIASTCQSVQLPKSIRGKRKSIKLFLPKIDEAL